MTVAYLPPMTYSGAHVGESLLMEAVESGPAYARSRRSTRWHLVRSAVDELRAYDGEIHRSIHYWCGASTFGDRALTADAPPTGEPVCGTCYGRREGADPDRPDLLFSPRLMRTPKVCPGSQTHWYTETTGHNRGICWACGEHVKIRGFGGTYNWQWGVQRHPPGPGLIAGCEFHGWRHLVQATSSSGPVVVCACRTKES